MFEEADRNNDGLIGTVSVSSDYMILTGITDISQIERDDNTICVSQQIRIIKYSEKQANNGDSNKYTKKKKVLLRKNILFLHSFLKSYLPVPSFFF